MRAVAKRAGVDMALVHYFFGTKANLFTASVELPIEPERVAALLSEPARSRGETMARYYLEDARLRAELVGAQMLGLFISRCVVGVEPLANASVEDVVALLAPALDRLLETQP